MLQLTTRFALLSIGTTFFLSLTERIFSPPVLTLDSKSLALVISILFILSLGSTLLVISFDGFKYFEDQRNFPGKIKYIVVSCIMGTVFFALGLHLSRGAWISQQTWVPFFAPTLGILFGGISVGASILYQRLLLSKHRKIASLYGVLFGIAMAYLYSTQLGGSYQFAYLTFLFATSLFFTAALSLSIPATGKKVSYLIIVSFLSLGLGTQLLIPKNVETVKRAEWNSKTFSNVTGVFSGLFIREDRALVENVLRGFEQLPEQRQVKKLKHEVNGKNWNVLYIVVDTLRADILSPWRQKEKQSNTPFLDRFISESVHFERAYAHASVTRSSMPTLFTSKNVNTGINEARSLGLRMKSSGRETFAILPSYFFVDFEEHRGLREGIAKIDVFENHDQNEVLPLLIANLDGLAKRNWFGWIHFFNMHSPYFADKLLSWTDRKEAYTQAAAWLDREFKKLYSLLKERDLLDKTIIVLSSDHGEWLGEEGRFDHGATILEEDMRIPLAIRIPGVKGRKYRKLSEMLTFSLQFWTS